MFLYRLFNNSSPFVFVLMPLTMLLLWGKALITGAYFTFSFDDYQMPCYYFINRLLGGSTYPQVITGFVLTAVQVALLVRLNVKYILIENRSFLPAFIFIFFTACFFQMQRQHPALWSNLFVLIAIDRLFVTYRREKAFSEVFDVSLLISIGSLFYFNTIYFIFFFWIAFMAIKPFRVAEWVISLMGLVAPYFIAGAYYYLAGKLPVLLDLLKNNLFADYDKLLYLGNSYYLFFLFLLFVFIISFFYFLQGTSIRKVVVRRYYTIFILLVCTCAGAFFLLRSASSELLIFSGLPISFLFAFFLTIIRKKWIKELFVLSFILLIAATRLFN